MQIGNHSKLLQSGWGWVVFYSDRLFWYLCRINEKNYEIYTFTWQGGGGLSFITNRKCLAHEILMLKSYFKFMARNFVHESCMQIR